MEISIPHCKEFVLLYIFIVMQHKKQFVFFSVMSTSDWKKQIVSGIYVALHHPRPRDPGFLQTAKCSKIKFYYRISVSELNKRPNLKENYTFA
jgi:hypothetical protein